MLDLRDIHSLSEFQRNAKGFLHRMKQDRAPIVLTVNGRAEVVVQDAESYQQMLDRLERAEAVAAVLQGVRDFENGESEDARTALDSLREKHAIPR